jgi:hypothetical protein
MAVILLGWILHLVNVRHGDLHGSIRFSFLFSGSWAFVAVALSAILVCFNILWLELLMVLAFLMAHTASEIFLSSQFSPRATSVNSPG